MYYLSDDPWPLASGLALVGLGFLIPLWLTQQGKYLVRSLVAFGLALAVLGVEQLWVTDNERIEAVVYDLARGVENRDPDRIVANLAPEARVEIGTALAGQNAFFQHAVNYMATLQGRRLDRETLAEKLDRFKFDYVRVGSLTANAGQQTRQGTAEFRVHILGDQLQPYHPIATPASGLGFELGFRETSPGVWKVTRITPTSRVSEFQETASGGGR
jgi:hypothetical protein